MEIINGYLISLATQQHTSADILRNQNNVICMSIYLSLKIKAYRIDQKA